MSTIVSIYARVSGYDQLTNGMGLKGQIETCKN